MAADNKDFQWQLLSANEEKNGGPSSRTYFTMVTRGESLFFFGGFGDCKGRYNDLRCFNTATSSWETLSNVGVFPKPIYLHSAAVEKDHMYVFGGSSGKDTNDFYDYNFASKSWTMLAKSEGIHYPCPRYGHASVVCNGRFLVVGGCKQTMSYFQDAYSFDLTKRTWSKLGDIPLDMAYHSLCAYNNRVYLFGGYNGVKFGEALYVLNWDTGQWNKVTTKGAEPPPRCGCAAQVVEDSLWVFGGYTAGGHSNDLYRLDLLTWTWHAVAASNKPLSRAYLQAAVVGGMMYIFGGYDGQTCVTDFCRLPLLQKASPPPSTKPVVVAVASPTSSSTGASVAVDVLKVLKEQTNLTTQVSFVMKHFSKNGSVLDSDEVGKLLASLCSNLQTTPQAAPAEVDSPSVKEAMSMGFSRSCALAGIKLMQSQGQDVNNVNLLLNVLFDHPELAQEAPAPVATPAPTPAAPSKTAQEELTELQQCKICFERVMDCAMIPCGHLIGCRVCANDAAGRKLGCPLCRRPITGHLAVYWS